MDFPVDVPVLTDGVVTLRAHASTDVAGVYEQMVDPEMVRWTTVPVPGSLEAAGRYVHQVIPEGWRTGRSWAFAVEAVDGDGTRRYCGTVELRDQDDGRAEVAYGGHPWARGRGVMERALRLLLAWGFTERGLMSVVWWSHTGNWASRKLAWRLGFGVDGTVRRWLPQRGELRDAWVGVLLAGDDRAPRHPWLTAPRIESGTVALRALHDRDARRIVEACTDESTRLWLSHLPHPYTHGTALSYVLGRHDDQARGQGVWWAVTPTAGDDLVGTVCLFGLKAGHEAEVGYWTHPAARGRGVATEAVRLAVRHAFVPEEDGGLGLRRLMLYAAEGNTASRRVAEANGFVAVGRERSGYRLGDGSVTDTVCYDLLLPEYTASRTG